MAFTVRVQAIIPKGWQPQKVQLFVKQALHAEGKHDQKEFAKTVSGWSSAPTMRYNVSLKMNEASVWIGPSGSPEMVEKWRRIDEGVEHREIKSQTTMVFPWQGVGISYDAKTTPRQFSSRARWTKKGPIRRTKHIKHHYITPRLWSETLGKQRREPFRAAIQDAINRGMAP